MARSSSKILGSSWVAWYARANAEIRADTLTLSESMCVLLAKQNRENRAHATAHIGRWATLYYITKFDLCQIRTCSSAEQQETQYRASGRDAQIIELT